MKTTNFYNKNKNYNKNKELIEHLKNLEYDLNCIHNRFNYVTEPLLIDSYSYELLSLHKKYQFYLKELKALDVS
jgi:hypothetical protein